ncbi:hypothetical protein CDAR_304471 [Caerostris darwini]|uniref:Ribosomal protein L28 n=1 Tax=Caerostris darwini TaxID=1538125 RepID=A0AAV4NJI5_9ARAC|nr:hypothetical protein CDAR_304471 [Caerostris darwini]
MLYSSSRGRLARKRNRLFVNSHFNRTVALIDGTSSRKNTKWGPNQGLQGGQQPLVQIALTEKKARNKLKGFLQGAQRERGLTSS